MRELSRGVKRRVYITNQDGWYAEMINPENTKTAFKERLTENNKAVSSLNLADGLSAMLGFYRDMRMKGCRLDEDEDIMLFHWGSYSGGNEETFEVAIARQLIVDSGTSAEAIWQLTLSFEYTMTEELQEQDSGQEWCYSPADLAEYEKLVLSLDAYTSLESQAPAKVELLYECVG